MIRYIVDEMEDILDSFVCMWDVVILPILLDVADWLLAGLCTIVWIVLVITVPLWIVPYLLIKKYGGKA